MLSDDSSSSFVFPVGDVTLIPLPSIGTSYNPVEGTAGTISGIPDDADLDRQENVQQTGSYTSIKDSNSFAAALKLSMAASGGGWGASVGVVASASCTTASTATSYSILYAALNSQYTQRVTPDQELTDDALAALNDGTFFQNYGTHFVSGYVYGYVCNLSYLYEFTSQANFAAFSADYSESTSELGFNDKTSASIDSAMKNSNTQSHQSIAPYCKGFLAPAVTSMKLMQDAIDSFNAARAVESQTPIMLIVEPWTSLDQVREVLDPNGLITGGPLEQLAELTNNFVYIQQTASNFINSGGYAGTTQFNKVQAILTTTTAKLEAISTKLAAVAAGGPALQQSDVDAFGPSAPVLSDLQGAMTQFAVNLQITGGVESSPCVDINGKPVDAAALAAGVTLYVDWASHDDPNVIDPQLSMLVATGALASVVYITGDRSTGELWILAQAQDGGPENSPHLKARGNLNGEPESSLNWNFASWVPLTVVMSLA
jgi:hypothetical protein